MIVWQTCYDKTLVRKSLANLLSYSTLYSRDHEGLRFPAKKYQPNPFSLTTTWKYWLGIIKPKRTFRATRNAFDEFSKKSLFNRIFY